MVRYSVLFIDANGQFKKMLQVWVKMNIAIRHLTQNQASE